MQKLSINPGLQSYTSGSISDQVAQQTFLSVFKTVLSMQSMGCHSVSEQLMAAGVTQDNQSGHGTDSAETGNRDRDP